MLAAAAVAVAASATTAFGEGDAPAGSVERSAGEGSASAPDPAPRGDDPEPMWRVEPDESDARSIGAPNDGALRNGEKLPQRGPGFRHPSHQSSWGLDRVVAAIRYLGRRLRRTFPGSAPLVIGDLSRRGGGPLPPHASHQSGRDVDIGFPERGNPEHAHLRGDLDPEAIDYAKSWFVIETLLLTGRVRYVFVDRPVLHRLRERAREVGWRGRSLERLFQRPGEEGTSGIIRYEPGHDGHFHVRFRCPEGAERCRGY